ncbi:hypothetical protein [Sphingopyxis panaciterrae]
MPLFRTLERSRRLFLPLGAVVLWLAPAAYAAEFTPATLGIATTDGNNSSIAVRTAEDLRNAIKPCFGPQQCEEISVETCDRCVIYAASTYGGYRIYSRLGPPGALYELLDKRPGRKDAKLFSLADATTIFIDYLTESETIPVGHRNTGDI